MDDLHDVRRFALSLPLTLRGPLRETGKVRLDHFAHELPPLRVSDRCAVGPGRAEVERVALLADIQHRRAGNRPENEKGREASHLPNRMPPECPNYRASSSWAEGSVVCTRRRRCGERRCASPCSIAGTITSSSRCSTRWPPRR